MLFSAIAAAVHDVGFVLTASTSYNAPYNLARRLATLIEPVEAIVNRIDYLVAVGETAMSPLAVTESALRGVLNAMRNRMR